MPREERSTGESMVYLDRHGRHIFRYSKIFPSWLRCGGHLQAKLVLRPLSFAQACGFYSFCFVSSGYFFGGREEGWATPRGARRSLLRHHLPCASKPLYTLSLQPQVLLLRQWRVSKDFLSSQTPSDYFWVGGRGDNLEVQKSEMKFRMRFL